MYSPSPPAPLAAATLADPTPTTAATRPPARGEDAERHADRDRHRGGDGDEQHVLAKERCQFPAVSEPKREQLGHSRRCIITKDTKNTKSSWDARYGIQQLTNERFRRGRDD